ncbi:hypothetical protein [Pseudomonas sp. NPDC096950]|uniref:DUF7706 family protein n=1 Tax=Pseudomonas sp. NPDC096950 TaxID=3364485 RepID=UPI00383B5DE4
MTETPGSRDRNALSLTTAAGTTEREFLTEAETMALAQFANRVGWFEFTSNALGDDEAHLMKQAFDKLQDVLARSGFAPG